MKMTQSKVAVVLISIFGFMPLSFAEGNTQQNASAGPPYGPGMMMGVSPEQRQQHWEQMRAQGYNPGMMRGMTPEQREQHWAQMRAQGHRPGMMHGMTPEERQKHWEQMRSQGYGPGMMRGRMMRPNY